ncbi:ADP-ribosylglycohydrolase family protein [uncultured Methanobrevibacter sp.]|uniref:ADP-ribosylglycohydrolase family protein n=1 Tax=uncultured Methanobrevibacter sp. TaxID=253161 RepID=UPI0025E0065D|nr:ADP-ribosylglycohydrolase family protein [uncultured Methanobrevibacter sp.]
MAYKSAVVTHNHPEGIKGALATVDAIYLAKNGAGKDEIRNHVENEYGYDLNRTVDGIRPSYTFDVSCAGSVPESIICFLDADDFEDAIRNAVSLGGDADTQSAIAGSIAGAYWDVPKTIADMAVGCLDNRLYDVLTEFCDVYG